MTAAHRLSQHGVDPGLITLGMREHFRGCEHFRGLCSGCFTMRDLEAGWALCITCASKGPPPDDEDGTFEGLDY